MTFNMPPKKRVRVVSSNYWEVINCDNFSLYGFILYKFEYDRPDHCTKATIYKEYEDKLKELLEKATNEVEIEIIKTKIDSFKQEKNSDVISKFWTVIGSNNIFRILNFIKNEVENYLQIVPTSSSLLKHEIEWNKELSKLRRQQFSDDLMKNMIYTYFIEFRGKLRSTAYDDPMFSFVLDFYDPRGYYFDKQKEVFGNNLTKISSIEFDSRFSIDQTFSNFIKKCLMETFVNIPDNLTDDLKKSYYIASQLVNMIKILNKDEKLRAAHVKEKVYDEGTWCMKTIDKIIEIFVILSEEFSNKVSHSVGESSDKCTKTEIYSEYDKHVIDSFNDTIKRKKVEKGTCKKPDAKIYWIDNKRQTTLLASEVSGGPTNELDIVKNEGDRRKLIRTMKTVSQNFWRNLEGWHNKSISADNLKKLKGLTRVLIHIYGFKFALMLYDEEYFPFARVRLISDMEIPFRDLEDVDAIITFISNLITTYHFVKKSYETLNRVFNDVKKSEMQNIYYTPITKVLQVLPCRLLSPKKN